MQIVNNIPSLRVFLAYTEDIKLLKGINYHQQAKQANYSTNLYYNCKRVLRGQKCFVPKITLNFIVHLQIEFGVPFDLGKYMEQIRQEDEAAKGA